MKKSLLVIVSTIVLTGAALFVGCNKQESGVTSGARLASAEKNSFKEVTSQLDAGGDLYLYLSTEQLLDGISGKISGLREVLGSIPELEAEQRDQIGKAFDIVTGLVKSSGIEDVSGFGLSSIATEKGFYHSKAFLHHYPNRGSGFLWNLFGEQQHALNGLDLLPANTALATFSDLNAQLVWSEIQKQVNQSGIPQAKDFLDQFPAAFEKATGLKWEKVLGSLGGEYGVVLTLDETKMIPIPMSEKLEVPKPGLMIAIKVKDETIFNRVELALQKTGLGVVNVDKSNLKMRTVAVPLPLPIQLRPTMAAAEGWLFIATTDAMIQEALAVKSGQKPGLKATDEFKRLSRDIPQQGNQFSFMSQRFGKMLVQIQQQALAATGKVQPAQMQWLQSFVQPDKVAYSYCVSANTSEGWLTAANGNQHPAKMFLLPAVIIPVGVLSAIAIPNFVKARETSQRNACINNLRQIDAAKAQWALEKGKTTSDVPTEEDLSPYLSRSQTPACPAGGHYTIGAVRDRPTCSVAGHRLRD